MNKHCHSDLKFVERADSYKECHKKCKNNQQCWNSCFPDIEGQAAYNLAVCAQKNNCLALPEEVLLTMLESADKCIQTKCVHQLLNQKRERLAARSCLRNCRTDKKCLDHCMAMDGEKAA